VGRGVDAMVITLPISDCQLPIEGFGKFELKRK
jgi:hypothetical protein